MAKILVVDDEEDFRLILSVILQKGGHEVSESRNGEEALALIGKQDIELVIADWNMPIMDGPALVGRLRENPKTRMLPVIMLTVRQAPNDQLEGVHQGADLYLAKPVESEELLLRVKALLRRGK
ncbi:response regulator transcription factor [Elusimicrobiota bacterium]